MEIIVFYGPIVVSEWLQEISKSSRKNLKIKFSIILIRIIWYMKPPDNTFMCLKTTWLVKYLQFLIIKFKNIENFPSVCYKSLL